MMKHYVKMKRMEIQLKLQIYGYALAFLEEKKGVAELLGRLYTALKDVPLEELRDQAVECLVRAAQGGNEKSGQ